MLNNQSMKRMNKILLCGLLLCLLGAAGKGDGQEVSVRPPEDVFSSPDG